MNEPVVAVKERKNTPWGVVVLILLIIAVIFVIKGAFRQATISPPPNVPAETNSPVP